MYRVVVDSVAGFVFAAAAVVAAAVAVVFAVAFAAVQIVAPVVVNPFL